MDESRDVRVVMDEDQSKKISELYASDHVTGHVQLVVLYTDNNEAHIFPEKNNLDREIAEKSFCLALQYLYPHEA